MCHRRRLICGETSVRRISIARIEAEENSCQSLRGTRPAGQDPERMPETGARVDPHSSQLLAEVLPEGLNRRRNGICPLPLALSGLRTASTAPTEATLHHARQDAGLEPFLQR